MPKDLFFIMLAFKKSWLSYWAFVLFSVQCISKVYHGVTIFRHFSFEVLNFTHEMVEITKLSYNAIKDLQHF